MQYREKLHPWIVVQLLPEMQRVIRGRFRRESEADGHLRVLRQHIPDSNFVVMFDPPILEATDEHKET